MKREQRLSLAISLCLLVVGATGCTSDFRVRRIDSAAASLSAQQCFSTLGHDASNPARRAARRQATDRLLTLYANALLTAPGRTLRVPIESGQTLTLTLRRGMGQGGADPSDYTALEPTDNFVVDRVDRHSQTSGEGAPLVGTLRPLTPVNSPDVTPAKPIAGAVRAVTAVANVDPHGSPAVTFSLYDPRNVPGLLAADYTTPIALNLAHFRPQRRGLRGLMRGGDYIDATGLYPLETPTTEKTPLVLVHGLISDPGDFYRLENDLADSDEVRRRYQVWVFYYPTSLPVVYSAMLLREDVDRFIGRLDPAGTHPALHRAVLVGHSMGGLLSRLAVSDGGEHFYRHFFRKPPEQLTMSDADRAQVRRAFCSPGSANVARVIFISTPHRGSSLATGPLGNLGRLLLHLPSTLQKRMTSMLSSNRDALAVKGTIRPGSSLDSLSPKGPVIAAVNDVPIRPGVGLHSIIGNRGRPGPLEKSSDGVVLYTSSHLPQAESELIVPAGHTGALLRPETSAEVTRILCQ